MSDSIHRFILRAYGIADGQLGGAPDWFKKDLYSIEAVTSVPSSPAQMMLMMRRMLADRFQLKLARRIEICRSIRWKSLLAVRSSRS